MPLCHILQCTTKVVYCEIWGNLWILSIQLRLCEELKQETLPCMGMCAHALRIHYSVFIMRAMASQITFVSIVYPTVCSGADKIKHQSSASQAFVRGIHRWPVNSPHKGPVTRKMLPFDDVIMRTRVFLVLTLTEVLTGRAFHGSATRSWAVGAHLCPLHVWVLAHGTW